MAAVGMVDARVPKSFSIIQTRTSIIPQKRRNPATASTAEKSFLSNFAKRAVLVAPNREGCLINGKHATSLTWIR